MKKYLSLLWLLAILCVSVCPISASAHAYVAKSVPQQESELKDSPAEIRLLFTEKINTDLSTATLKDATGKTISTKQSGENGEWLILSVPPLENGVYYVDWQVLSVDSHVTEGSFRFAVGVDLPKIRPSETRSLDDPVGEPQDQEQPTSKNFAPPTAGAPSKQAGVLSAASKPRASTASHAAAPAKGSAIPAIHSSLGNEESRQAAAAEPGSQMKTADPSQATNTGRSTANVQGQPANVKEPSSVKQPATAEQPVLADQVPSSNQAGVSVQTQQGLQVTHHHHNHDNSGSWLRVIEMTAAIVVGGLIFLSVWKGYREAVRESNLKFWEWEKAIFASAVLLFIACDSAHIYGVAQTLSVDSAGIWEKALGVVTSTLIGTASLLRIFFMSGLLLLSSDVNNGSWRVGGRILLFTGVVITFPLNSHEMSGQWLGGVPLASHAIHIAAAAIWIGGLAGLTYLTFALRSNLPYRLPALLKQFSRIAFISVLIITITGLVITILKLRTWDELIHTTYGNLLLGKLALFEVALCLAGFQRYRILPEPKEDVRKTQSQMYARSLLWSLRGELLTAVAIIVLAGLLATTAPPM